MAITGHRYRSQRPPQLPQRHVLAAVPRMRVVLLPQHGDRGEGVRASAQADDVLPVALQAAHRHDDVGSHYPGVTV